MAIETKKGFVMRIAAQLSCLCYWLLLTVLLLVPNPAALVGMRAVPTFPWGKFGVHLIAFIILAVLVHGTRWPKRLWWPLFAFLVVYGITTESLQLFVPHRTARVMDGIENILGIALGSGIYWLLQRSIRPLMKLSLASELMKYAGEAEAIDVR
ncbi:MAG: VanZ family protein [Thermoguttaceae bacterium]